MRTDHVEINVVDGFIYLKTLKNAEQASYNIESLKQNLQEPVVYA